MSIEITSAFEGLDQSVIDAISTPEVLERITAYAEKSKTGLVAKNQEVLGKYAELNKQITDLGGFDTLKSLATQATEARIAKEAALAKSGDVEAIRKQAADALTAKDTELTSLKQSVVTEKVNSALAKAVREAKGDADLLAPHLASRVQGSLENGKVVIKVLGADGQPMLTKDMREATMADLLSEYRTSFPKAFDAVTVTGTGAKGTDTNTQGIVNPFLAATRSMTKQMELARTNPDLAKAMFELANPGKTLNLN